jgi:riboflavin synthase
MFTGIITEVGRVTGVTRLANGVELTIDAPLTAPRLALGASVAINGVCQTVVAMEPPRFRVQAVGATMERTTFGTLRTGTRLNLEPSLRLGDELGGHLVSGHVDGLGRVESVTPAGDAVLLTVTVPAELARFVALRGSISIDGVSLTVAALADNRVTISVIPHTIQQTILGDYRAGNPVNLEVDLVARYLDRLLGGSASGLSAGAAPTHDAAAAPTGRPASRVTWDTLKESF